MAEPYLPDPYNPNNSSFGSTGEFFGTSTPAPAWDPATTEGPTGPTGHGAISGPQYQDAQDESVGFNRLDAPFGTTRPQTQAERQTTFDLYEASRPPTYGQMPTTFGEGMWQEYGVNQDVNNNAYVLGQYFGDPNPAQGPEFGRGWEEDDTTELEKLIQSGVIPPRLAAALRPLIPGGPDPYRAMRPLGGYRPLSRQTYNRLLPSDVQALEGTQAFLGNFPEDLNARYRRPMYAPQVRYGGRVRLG